MNLCICSLVKACILIVKFISKDLELVVLHQISVLLT